MNKHDVTTPALIACAALTMTATDAFADPSPRGRLHLDYAAHREDSRPLGDGFHVRRARMGLDGSIGEQWRYRIEYDFAENASAARDVYLRYSGLPAGHLSVGQFKVPFGLEELTSSNHITLIERSLPTTSFAQAFRLGVGYSLASDNWHISLMGFGQPSGAATRSTDGDEGLGFAARLVFTPLRAGDRVLHLGVAATTESPADRKLRQAGFASRPESRPSNVRLVDTGLINEVQRTSRLGLESAWRAGPLSIQGEWMHVALSRHGDAFAPDFSGWYISGSWILTGESRRHDGSVFQSVKPTRASGAWELTARLSRVNLSDGPIVGGDQRNATLGINWYAGPNIRFMANAIFARSRRGDQSDDPAIVLTRAQVAF